MSARSKPAWHAEALRLRAQGYSHDKIAILLGKSKRGVGYALTGRDPAAHREAMARFRQTKAGKRAKRRHTKRQNQRRRWQTIDKRKARYVEAGILGEKP